AHRPRFLIFVLEQQLAIGNRVSDRPLLSDLLIQLALKLTQRRGRNAKEMYRLVAFEIDASLRGSLFISLCLQGCEGLGRELFGCNECSHLCSINLCTAFSFS